MTTEEHPHPVAAKIKKPKGLSKTVKENKQLEKAVAAKTSSRSVGPKIAQRLKLNAAIARGVDPELATAANPNGRTALARRSVFKEEYNHHVSRLRNQAVECLFAPEDKAGRASVRALLKPFRHFEDMRRAIIQAYTPAKFEAILARFFDPLDELKLKAEWEKKIHTL
tara:strand:+ start:5273 stop:5776 length:504 start_codon:yes stop_codon:yes gene_type:complete